MKKLNRILMAGLAVLCMAACEKSNQNDQGGDDSEVYSPEDPDTDTDMDTDPDTPELETGFARGADVSWLTEMEASGYKFYSSDGVETECMELLHSLGMNAVRLRVWVNPTEALDAFAAD